MSGNILALPTTPTDPRDVFVEETGGTLLVRGTAKFTTDRAHRFELTRTWDASLPRAVVVGLNPSRAGAERGDLTVTKGCVFSRAWGCGSLVMLNLSSLVSTDPRGLLAAGPDATRKMNDLILAAWLGARDGGVFVAAWGSQPGIPMVAERARQFMAMAEAARRPLKCLGLTKDGSPRHPSRIAYATPLIDFAPAGGAR